MKELRHVARTAVLLLFTASPVALAQRDLTSRLASAATAERAAAVLEVGKSGAAARPFVPRLVELMADAELDVAVAVFDACNQLGAAIVGDAAAAATARDGQALLVAAAVLGHAARTAPEDRQAALLRLVDTELASTDARRRLLAAAAFGALADCGVGIGQKLLLVLAEEGSIATPAASRTVWLHGERLRPMLHSLVREQPKLASAAFVRALPANQQDKDYVDLLVTLVTTTEGYPRRCAIERLGNLGPRAAEHLPLVEAALTAPTRGVREAALVAFQRISRDEDRVAEKLADALTDPDPRVVHAALRASASDHPFLPRAISRMVTLLGTPECRDAVIDAFAWDTKVSREALQPALDAADLDTHIAAVRVLVHQGLATDADLAPAQQWLHSDQMATRAQALQLVRALSGSRPELLPAVMRLLKGDDRGKAIAAVASFGEKADDAAGRLLSALKDKDRDVRREAACAIAVVAPGRRDVVTALVHGVKDPEIAPWCHWGLSVMGREAKAAVAGLRRLLLDAELADRCDVVRTLASVGEPEKVVPVLLDVIKDGRLDECRVAIGKLADLFEREQSERARSSKVMKMTGVWRPVVKVLVEQAGSAEPAVRAAAYETLGVLAIDDEAAQAMRAGLSAEGEVLSGVLRGLARGRLELAATEVDRLAEILQHGEDDQPALAGRALARGGPQAHGRLFLAMANGSPRTRRGAVLGLRDLPTGLPMRDEVFAVLSTGDREMRWALASYFRQFARDQVVLDRLVARWQAADDDIALRRTLACIASTMLVAGWPEQDRLRAKLMADDDPFVKVQAARAAQ